MRGRDARDDVSTDEMSDWDDDGEDGEKVEEGRDANEMGDGGRPRWLSRLR